MDQQRRKQIYAQVQQILARDLPYINLWYFDNVVVHSQRVQDLQLNPSGNYDFLARGTGALSLPADACLMLRSKTTYADSLHR